jgi:hypothetical protein
MTSSDAAIIPISLTVNGQTGITLYAPPWEDEDGEEWQGFLGDGSKILLFPHADALAEFIASKTENDLSDHPAWSYVVKLPPGALRPGPDDHYDLDQVYEWASGDPDPVHVSALANVVDMVARIADCCDDGALRRLVENTPAYEELVDDEVGYQGRDGRKRWDELGRTISETWERAVGRVSTWLSWAGEFFEPAPEPEMLWERMGAEPIEIRLPDATYLTVRGEVPADAEASSSDVVFLGTSDTVAVFTDVADLAEYCRRAKDTPLARLEYWHLLSDVSDDEFFRPSTDARYDLRKPSSPAAALVRELITFCRLAIDTSALSDARPIDRDDWREILREVSTCLVRED